MEHLKNSLKYCILLTFLIFLANHAYADNTAVQVPVLVYHEIVVDNDCKEM